MSKPKNTYIALGNYSATYSDNPSGGYHSTSPGWLVIKPNSGNNNGIIVTKEDARQLKVILKAILEEL